MYGIFAYIWVIFRANVDKYSIHGAYGIEPTLGDAQIRSLMFWITLTSKSPGFEPHIPYVRR